MARRAYLHVGTAKSGTTYLHDLWWQHHDELRERGLLLPGTVMRDHFVAAGLVKGMDALVRRLDDEQQRTWDRLLEQTGDWPQDVLISHEHFSDTGPEAAAQALARLGEVAEEVHVVLTVRDLARVLPSSWQQRVKQGTRQTYGRFLDAVRDGDDEEKFWRYQDVPAVVGRWSAGLPRDRVHLVTVPPPGAARDELWLRTARVLGLDLADLATEPRLPNDSLGIVEAELLRRANGHLPGGRKSLETTRYRKGAFTREVLAGSAAEPEAFVLPREHAGWVRRRSAAMVADLRDGGWDVVGDLGDLLAPPPQPGRTPDDVADEELLAAATTVLDRIGGPASDSLDAALDAIAAHLLERTGPGSTPTDEPAAERQLTAMGRVMRRLTGRA